MGKSAKFYKRPSKKEKEGVSVKKLVEPSIISKRDSKKTVNVPTALFQKKTAKAAAPTAEDIDMITNEEVTKEVSEKKKSNGKEPELPDYVDLFSGKKTFKKIPLKRK